MGRARCEPESGGDLLSEIRTTVDRTEAEQWESERNRVAWNLPLGAGPAPSKRIYEAVGESQDSRDALENAAANG
jgi:hypothetical protein